MHTRGPFSDSYVAAVALVVFALAPYLVLSTAFLPLSSDVAREVGLSQQGLELSSGMANAAYAFGTVLAVQLAVHLPGRRLLIGYAALFVVASVLAATAVSPGLFVAGRITQGLCTSLMLIAAVPPLVIGWPASKVPITGAIMNMCIFGAVAIGPVIGGLMAVGGHWQPLLWIIAGLGAVALLFATLTFEDQPALDRSAPWDWVAQALAGVGCAAAFFGASELTTHAFLDPIVIVPLLTGIALVIALVVFEGLIERPLMPVRRLASSLPTAGILIAMTAGAASVSLIQLTQTAFEDRVDPGHLGTLFWPLVAGAAVAAITFGLLLRTKAIIAFPLVGGLLLAAGGLVLTGVAKGPESLVVIGTGLVGIGVGACVSPALFLVGFSQHSAILQRVFALVELLRGTAAFVAGPILLHVARTVGNGPAVGTETAIWLAVAIVMVGVLGAGFLFAAAGVRSQRPALGPWLANDSPALDSPPLLAKIRNRNRAANAASRSTRASRPGEPSR